MIEFIQDYVTKALPPESFATGDKVERSPESEQYFVRLGVAGFLVDGKLVDQDYQPITRTTTVLVVTQDRRFADTGRGGEVMTLDAPARATSGPGNAVIMSGQPDSMSIGNTELDQLRSDLASSASQFEAFRTDSAGEVERLKGLVEAGNTSFREMNNAHVHTIDGLRGEIEALKDAAEDAAGLQERLTAEAGIAAEQLGIRDARIAELETQLAAKATSKAK